MNKTLGWLHISDIHFLAKHDYRANPVLAKLRDDVADLRRNGLRIDLVFCTGDIGYGETSKDPLKEQYATAKDFFDKVLNVCELGSDRLFIVPGNHDIDRTKLLDSQTEYFRSAARSVGDINQKFRDRHGEIVRAMERLDQYRQFAKDTYSHIVLDNNATFGTLVVVNSLKVSIAGLNSAWTCADDKDKEKLWLAGEAQLYACDQAVKALSVNGSPDIRIALMHHPLAWLRPEEAQLLRGRLQNDFDFLLHGHEHDQWVSEIPIPYHIVIAAGAASAEAEAEFGYNLVQLGLGKANVHLRGYERKGDGWAKQVVAGRAPDGVWSVTPPKGFATIDQPVVVPPYSDAKPIEGSPQSRGYFGLDDVLAKCSAQLKKTPLVALYGLAGVGKTVIVDELRHRPEWRDLLFVPIIVQESAGLNDVFGQLAPYLGLHDERPRPPVGKSSLELADALRRVAPNVAPLFIHIQRGHFLFSGGGWSQPQTALFLEGLIRAYPGSSVVVETREQPTLAGLTIFEASGIPEAALADYLARPPGLGDVSWSLNRDKRRYIFQRLGGGHGRGAHAYGLLLLAQLAAGKGIPPDDILRSYGDDFSQELYEKLFRDLYENVLKKAERDLLFASSLYRNGLHYSHIGRLEGALAANGAGDSLVRRRLLTEEADWFYLHDLASEQARKIAPAEAQTRSLHNLIAGFWLADIGGQRLVIEANVRRALEAFYHLEQAGEGERVTEIAPELFGRRPDEVTAALWRVEERLNAQHKPDGVRVILEYLLKVTPDDHKAMRFLGECRRRLYGQKDSQALNFFRDATRLRPDFPQYWANYGHAATACGTQALQEFLAEVETAPPYAIDDHVAATKATALQAAGRGDEAAKLRQEKIEAGSSHATFYADQAKWLLDSKHDAEGALAVLEKALQRGCANDFTEAIKATALKMLKETN